MMQVLGRRKKIRVNTYRGKKKENQSESEKKYSVWKERLRKQKYTKFKKAKANVR